MTCPKTARLSGRATASSRPRATSAARAEEGSVNDTAVLSSRAPLAGAPSRVSLRLRPAVAEGSAVADAMVRRARPVAAVARDQPQPVAAARGAAQRDAVQTAAAPQHQPAPAAEQGGGDEPRAAGLAQAVGDPALGDTRARGRGG